MKYLSFLLFLNTAFALEVIMPVIDRKIELRIIRADPDSFQTYSLMNHNGREMMLVCAGNRVYDHNAKAFIEYRNYYNEIAGNFTIEDNQVCLDMGRAIETTAAGITEDRPFLITLRTKGLKVEKIVYPNLDPYIDEGTHKDLLPKENPHIRDFTPEKKEKLKPAKVLHN